MRILDLSSDMGDAREQCARLLVEGFAEMAPTAWPDLEAARKEVDEAISPERVNRILVDGGRVIAWAGAIPIYDGKVWEVHPLVVDPPRQRKGLGRQMLEEIEALATDAGVCTLWLGSDDEVGWTTLSGVDLYDSPLETLAQIRNLHGHPYEFYERCGFTVVGVLPDANGPGKPDIFLAKHVRGTAPPGGSGDPSGC